MVHAVPDKALAELIKRSGSVDQHEALAALDLLSKSVAQTLRAAILKGNVAEGIFQPIVLDNGRSYEYPVDLLTAGNDEAFTAWTNPGEGRIPERQVKGDYIMVPTYGIANSIDWLLRYARDGGYDIVGRCLQVLRAGFEVKMGNDGFHTLLTAATARNVIVHDLDAANGQFTKRLVSLLKVQMRRNGGGNSKSLNRVRATDIYMSPEGVEDIRNWNLDQIDEVTRREIYLSADSDTTGVFGVVLHALDEFGEGADFQSFFEDVLLGSQPAGDLEIGLALDRQNNTDAFVSPIREQVNIHPDPALHRQQKAGLYGWGEMGFGALDSRRLMLISY